MKADSGADIGTLLQRYGLLETAEGFQEDRALKLSQEKYGDFPQTLVTLGDIC